MFYSVINFYYIITIIANKCNYYYISNDDDCYSKYII